MHEVQDPVSAAKQNHGTADNCRHDQNGHVNLLCLLSPYAIIVHNIRTGRSMSPKSISPFRSCGKTTTQAPESSQGSVD